jgi:hypothetical protein
MYARVCVYVTDSVCTSRRVMYIQLAVYTCVSGPRTKRVFVSSSSCVCVEKSYSGVHDIECV